MLEHYPSFQVVATRAKHVVGQSPELNFALVFAFITHQRNNTVREDVINLFIMKKLLECFVKVFILFYF